MNLPNKLLDWTHTVAIYVGKVYLWTVGVTLTLNLVGFTEVPAVVQVIVAMVLNQYFYTRKSS